MFNVCVFYDILSCHLCLRYTAILADLKKTLLQNLYPNNSSKQNRHTHKCKIIINFFYEYSTVNNSISVLDAILVLHRPFFV